MPLISRTFIKAGLFFFLGSFITGVLMELESVSMPFLYPLFWHMLMVGWITQIIFGVSLWMFPGRNKQESFLAQKWGWLTFIFLNTGLIFRIISEPFLTTGSARTIWKTMVVLSAVLQGLAAVTYVIEMWNRVLSKEEIRELRKKNRER